jgi:hypothetical protein
MKHVLFAAVAVLGLATAVPAFADGGDNADRVNSANSLPSGFFANTPEQVQEQIKLNYFAAQQAKRMAKDTTIGGPTHVDILGFMFGGPTATAG